MTKRKATAGFLVLAAVALASACGDDTGGGGGGGACAEDETVDCTCADGAEGAQLCVDGSFTPCSKDGVGCVADASQGCDDGEQLFCKCADGSDGTKTCVVPAPPEAQEGQFSPCSDAAGDCTH